MQILQDKRKESFFYNLHSDYKLAQLLDENNGHLQIVKEKQK